MANHYNPATGRLWAPTVILLAVLVSTSPAQAQTMSGLPSSSAAQTATSSPGSSTANGSLPALPVPGSVVEQTREQLDGDYGTLKRPRTPGQIQRAWDRSSDDAAVYATAMCTGCTYKVRLREYMVSVLELPRGEIVDAVDLGDKAGFSVQRRGPRRLALRTVGHGYDTTMLVYGRSGRVYPVYLRAEGFNADTVPDVVVRIEGAVTINDDPAVADIDVFNDDLAIGEIGHDATGHDDRGTEAALAPMEAPFPGSGARSGPANAMKALNGLAQTNPATPAGDFVAEAAFDPDTLRGWGEYELSGSDELRPETVFRDDAFTYIRFGKRWKDVELPTAYVVVDGIDELVNTRVRGETYIIESTRALITLKSGNSHLCIRFTGLDT